MNIALLTIGLLIPTITLSMDRVNSMWGSSPSNLSLSQLPASRQNQPTMLPTQKMQQQQNVNNNNNNNNAVALTPKTVRTRLCNILFGHKMDQYSTFTIDSNEMQKAVADFKEQLQKHAKMLKGPDFHSLMQHVFKLESAIEEKTIAIHQPHLADLEKTIDTYLNTTDAQHEILDYSFYITPVSLQYPFSDYYINFYQAADQYIKHLEENNNINDAKEMWAICTILEERNKNLIQANKPNADLTCRSKLATFATQSLESIPWLKNSNSWGLFNFELSELQTMLPRWQALMPANIGIEAAWGRRLPKDTYDAPSQYQEDRCDLLEIPGGYAIGIYDGHGGAEVAEHCSKKLLLDITQQPGFDAALASDNPEAISPFVENAFEQCNKLFANSKAGSMVLLAFLKDQKGTLVQLGDSEAVIIDKNGKPTPLTPYLHNTLNPREIARIENEHPGALVPAGNVKRVCGSLLATAGLGDQFFQKYFAKHISSKFFLNDGDTFVAGTDGFFEENYNSLSKEKRLQDIATTIVACQNKSAGKTVGRLMAESLPWAKDNKLAVVYRIK